MIASSLIDGPGRHRVMVDAAAEAQPLIADWGLAILAVAAGALFIACAIGWMVETYRRSNLEGELAEVERDRNHYRELHGTASELLDETLVEFGHLEGDLHLLAQQMGAPDWRTARRLIELDPRRWEVRP